MQTLVSTIGGVPGTGAITTVVGGSSVSNATTLQFVGASVTASGPSTAVVTIAGAGVPGGATGTVQYNAGGGTFAGINASFHPQGRLTLTSGSPVMTTNVTATSAIYYGTFIGNLLPIGGQLYTIPNDQIQCTLDTTNHANANLYDLFCMISTGAVTMVTGPAWTNTTTRATAITLYSGVWTNGATITSAYNAGLAHTLVTNAGTYVGTVYTTASGQTGMAINPTAVSGGTGNVLGLFNGYNRVSISAVCRDSASSWTYASTTWRAAHGSVNNRITWVDGLAQIPVLATYGDTFQTDATAFCLPSIGILLNASTGTPDQVAGLYSLTAGSVVVGAANATMGYQPALGLRFVQAMEATLNTGTGTYFGIPGATQNLQALVVQVSM